MIFFRGPISVKRTLIYFVLSIWFVTTANIVLAGQIITDDIRLWAKQLIKQEQTLEGMSVDRKAIGIMPFVQVTGDPRYMPLQKGLAIMLTVDLSKIKGITVLDRVRMQALIQELKLSESGLVKQDTAPRIGNLLRARWIIGGQYSEQKGFLDLESRLVQVNNASILDQFRARDQLERIFDLEKALVMDIVKALEIRLTAEEEKAIQIPFTTSLDALLAYSRGIHLCDKGKYHKAYKEFNKALKADPNLTKAREAIKEMKGLGLIPNIRPITPKIGLMNEIRRDSLSILDTLKSQAATMRLTNPKDAEERGEEVRDDWSDYYDYSYWP